MGILLPMNVTWFVRAVVKTDRGREEIRVKFPSLFQERQRTGNFIRITVLARMFPLYGHVMHSARPLKKRGFTFP